MTFKHEKKKVQSPKTDISCKFESNEIIQTQYDDNQIKRVLAMLGKHNVEDEINCNACGYDNCRNFAKALIQGKAEPEMCVSHMKEQAQRKANALIRCIPSPIVIADSKLNIIEYNEEFRDTFWNEEEHSDI